MVALAASLLGVPAASPMAPQAGMAAAHPGLTTTPVLSGLELPVNFDFDPAGRIYVALKSGLVHRYDGPGDATPTQVIDVRRETYDHWDRGLLGLTLDPGFGSGRPYLYLLYSYDKDPFGAGTMPRWGGAVGNDTCPTPPGGTDGCTSSGRLVRYTVANGVADPGSAQVLLDGSTDPLGGWCHQFSSHSIGDVQFGPDGMLYVGSGDGASFNAVDFGQFGGSQDSPTPVNPCNDRPGARGTALVPGSSAGGALRSQAVRAAPTNGYVSWDGAILRVDPDTGAAAAGSPLIGNGVAGDDRIVAYGLRNPYRFGFRPGTDQLWLGDVGWDHHEEINRFRTGAGQTTVPNFGWPCYEGAGRQGRYDERGIGLCESLYGQPNQSLGGVPSPLTAPYHSWPRAGEQPAPGCSSSGGGTATGGRFVDTPSWPASLRGAYVFSDYARSCIAALPLVDGEPDADAPVALVTDATAVALQIGPGDDLYYLDIVEGTLVRLRSTTGNQSPVARFTATPPSGPEPLTVEFDGSASSDPDQEQLTHRWDLDGDGDCDDATGVVVSRTYTSRGSVTVRLCVSDQLGQIGTAHRVISVGNTAPQVEVSVAEGDRQWRVDDVVTFAADGTDAEDGELPASAYTWAVELRHCVNEEQDSCHAHPISAEADGSTATLVAPDHEYYAYLRATVTVRDADGGVASDSVDARPAIASITAATRPRGLPVSVGGASGTSPQTSRFLVGGLVELVAPRLVPDRRRNHRFVRWSDGNRRAARRLTAPNGESRYVAIYRSSKNQPPALRGIRVKPRRVSLDASGTARVVVRTRALDDAGVSAVRARLVSSKGQAIGILQRTKGTPRDGIWRDVLTLDGGEVPPGRYRVKVRAVDIGGKVTSRRAGTVEVVRPWQARPSLMQGVVSPVSSLGTRRAPS